MRYLVLCLGVAACAQASDTVGEATPVAPLRVQADGPHFPSDSYLTAGGLRLAASFATHPGDQALALDLAGRPGYPLNLGVRIATHGTTGNAELVVANVTTGHVLPLVTVVGADYVGAPLPTLQAEHTYAYALRFLGEDGSARHSSGAAASKSGLPYPAALLGIPMDQVAYWDVFTTAADEGVVFGLSNGPHPGPAALDTSTGLRRMPTNSDVDDLVAHAEPMLAAEDGFSTTASIRFAATPGVGNVADGGIRIARIDRVPPVAHDDLLRGNDGDEFWVRPRIAFEPGARYAYVVTRPPGASWRASPLALLVRRQIPVSAYDAIVLGYDRAEQETIERQRQELDAMLDGHDRQSVVAAAAFSTLTVAQRLLDRRAALAEAPMGLHDLDDRTPLQRGMLLAMPRVARVVTGSIDIADSIDRETDRFYPDGSWQIGRAEFVLTLPADTDASPPTPTIVFGHGLTTSRELLFLIADVLAEAGYAAIAIDLPYHGERSVCRVDLECVAGSRCGSDGACRDSNGEPSRLRRIGNPLPAIPGLELSLVAEFGFPVTTGLYLLDFEDMVASRHHFMQAAVDLMQLTRILRFGNWDAVADFQPDGSDLMYLGVSLGGIVGGVLSAVEPDLRTLVLNVPGGGLIDLVTHSTFFGFTAEQLMAARGVAPGSAGERAIMDIARWALDPVDPLNFAQYAIGAPLEQTGGAAKRVLVQMADGDLIVPNSSTHKLAERFGVEPKVYRDLLNHMLLFDPFGASADARRDLIEFLDQR